MAEPVPAAPPSPRIVVGEAAFDVAAEMARLNPPGGDAPGGIGCFVGIVRGGGARPVAALELEHYPGMTEPALEAMAADAIARFGLSACTVAHRVGSLLPGEPIVLVLAASRHRAAALDATRMLIDRLKTGAPFWKRERYVDGGARWLEPTEADREAGAAWG